MKQQAEEKAAKEAEALEKKKKREQEEESARQYAIARERTRRERAEKQKEKIRKEQSERKERDNNLVSIDNNSFGDLQEKYEKMFNFFNIRNNGRIKKVERIQEKSNSIILLLTYTNENNETAYSILKNTYNNTYKAGSIFKEYFAGSFINTIYTKYPCFLKTYGIYQWKSSNLEQLEKLEKLEKNNDVGILNNLSPAKLVNDCQKNDYGKTVFVNIQYLPYFNDFSFILYEIFQLLYQIYRPFAELKEMFNYNNLKMKNIILYQPYGGKKYINFIYKPNDKKKEVSFKSKYMVKIKRYDDCFYNGNGYSSETDLKKINISCGEQIKKTENNTKNLLQEIIDSAQNTTTFDKKGEYTKENIIAKLTALSQLNDMDDIVALLEEHLLNTVINDEEYKKDSISKLCDLIIDPGKDMLMDCSK